MVSIWQSAVGQRGHPGEHWPEISDPFRTGNTGSNRRTSLDSDLAARTLSSRFRPKSWKGFVNRPSFEP